MSISIRVNRMDGSCNRYNGMIGTRFPVGMLVLTLVILAGAILQPLRAAADDRVIRLSTGEWPPFISQDLPGGGLLLDLVTRAFRNSGREVEYLWYPWKRSLALAQTAKVDGSVAWQKTPERERDFLLTAPVMELRNGFFYRKSQSFDWKTLSDLRGLRVGTTRGYAYRPEFRRESREVGLNLIDSDTDTVNLRLLLKGRIDVFPCNIEVAQFLLSKHFSSKAADQITYHPRLLQTAPLVLLISRGIPDAAQIVADFNKGLEMLKQSGHYDKIRRLELSPRKLKVAISNWPPRKIVDGENIGGIDPAILKELGHRTGVEFQYRPCPWARCLELARKGEVDLVTSVSKTRQRQDFLYFLGPPYSRGRVVFYRRTGDPVVVKGYRDLAGYPIGCLNGSVYFTKFDTDTGLDKVCVNRESQLLKMLVNQRVRIVIGYEENMDYAITLGGYSNRIEKLDYAVEGVPIWIAMAKRSSGLGQRFRLAAEIEKMVHTGAVKNITSGFFTELQLVQGRKEAGDD